MASDTQAGTEAIGLADVVEGSNRFAIEAYRRLAGTEQGNVVFSPSSLTFALAMTCAGARGETAREMVEVLGLPAAAEKLGSAFRELQQSTDSGFFRLLIANRLWAQRGYEILPEFLELTGRDFGARLAEADFEREAEAARAEINGWVESKTANRIRELIPHGLLTRLTRLVVVNAIYFLGRWEHVFAVQNTREQPFWVSPSDSRPVSMMRQGCWLNYVETPEAQIVELPYEPGWGSAGGKPGSFAMCVALPTRRDGLAELESGLSLETLRQWTQRSSRQVILELPRFEFGSDLRLGSLLEQMGMTRAFSNTADFSGITSDSQGLSISQVVQSARIAVDEKGTEAAAATGVMLTMLGGVGEPEEPVVFRADHPFLYFIRDRTSGLIHFLGRVTDPAGG